jgi:hypothetical protein
VVEGVSTTPAGEIFPVEYRSEARWRLRIGATGDRERDAGNEEENDDFS